MAIAAALFAFVIAHAQDQGSIAGRVIDAATGRPVAAAIVTLGGASVARVPASNPEQRKPGPGRILTSGDGRFVFRSLPVANFSVTAEKPGYAPGANGRRRPGGASHDVVLTPAQPAADVVIRIWKNGSIGGTLTDEAGEAVVRAQLRILQRTTVGGARKFVPTGVSALTDDRGIYRFGNLLPGDYLVAVSSARSSRPAVPASQIGRGGAPVTPGSPGWLQIADAIYSLARGSIVPPPVTNGRLMVYPTTFYPSAQSPAEASVITLGVGEEKTGVDVQVQPVATARVSGTLVGPDGPTGPVLLRLRPKGFDDTPLDQDVITAVTDAGGGFVLPAVPSGEYSLRATQVMRSASRDVPLPFFWTDTPISVSGDVDGVVATMRPGLSVTARQEFQGSAEPPQRTGGFRPPPFVLEPAEGDGSTASIGGLLDVNGQVTLTGLVPGRYLVRVRNSPAGWMFKSAILSGVDVSDTPFDLTKDIPDLVLTFTDKWSGLGGTVRGSDGNLDTNAIVAVFPTNADAWKNYGSTPRRLKSGATNANGEFAISSLPPGDYYAVAIPEDQSDDWRDPKMLDALSRVAMTITIVEGEHKTIALQTKDVQR
jgi:hypothetical protein